MSEDIETHKIMAMDPDKRDRVINAAMKEFKKGYKNACTDEIVREAGISKGLLFHYFGTKSKLYGFILKNATDLLSSEFFALINLKQQDIIEKIWQMTLLKMDLSYKHPALFDFLAAAYMDWLEDPVEEYSEYFDITRRNLEEEIYANTDTTIFKEEFDPRKIINIIRWTLHTYASSQITSEMDIEDYQKEYEHYLEEMKEYFDIFRKAFYK
jgi:AcrR family transcriptional regulator